MTENFKKGTSTRERIIAVARQLFAKNGYERTSTETVLEESGVSRGALYHHFENKEALFAAVLEAVEIDVTKATAHAGQNQTDPVGALHAACDAFLEMACEPEVRQIILNRCTFRRRMGEVAGNRRTPRLRPVEAGPPSDCGRRANS